MIDNLEKIIPLLSRDNEDEFYMVQIIQRRKDWNANEPNQHRVIKDYYIYSLEQLMKRYEEIRRLCDMFNARAYIRLSRRNARTMAKEMIVELWEAFRNDSFKHLRKIYSTVVWRSKWIDKVWLIDLDEKDYEWALTFGSLKRFLCNIKPVWEKLIEIIPTHNWVHFLTKPFDLKTFKEHYPTVDVHKNNPTILYSNLQ